MTTFDQTIPSVIQFENFNEGRSYPFDDDSVLEDDNGRIVADDTVVDMGLTIPEGHEAYMSSLRITDKLVSACVKVFNGDEMASAMSVMVAYPPTPFVPYRMEPLTMSEDSGGVITFGDFVLEECFGNHRFVQNGGKGIRICDSAIARCRPAGVRKFMDDRTGETVSGDVKIDFSGYVSAERSGSSVELKLNDGADKVLMSECDKNRPVNSCGATPITSINGVNPDSENRIVIWFH